MSDTKKTVEIEYKASGNNLDTLRSMRQEAEKLRDATASYQQLMGRSAAATGTQTARQQLGYQGLQAGGATAGLSFSTAGIETAINKLRMEMTQVRTTAREQLEYTKMPTAEYAGGAGSGGRAGGSAGGGSFGIPGMGNFAAGPAGAMMASVAALKTVESALNKMAVAAKTLNDPMMNLSQKFEHLAGQVPLVGGLMTAALELVKTDMKIGPQMQQGQMTHAIGMAEFSATAQAQRRKDQLEQQFAGLHAQMRATAGLTPYAQLQGNTRRETLAEQIGYSEHQRLLPHTEAIDQAQAKARAAGSDLRAAEELRGESAAELARREQAMQKHRNLLGDKLMNSDEIAGIQFGEDKPMGKGGAGEVAKRAAPYFDPREIFPDPSKVHDVGKRLLTDPQSLRPNDLRTMFEQSFKALPGGMGLQAGLGIQTAKAFEAETGGISDIGKSMQGQVEAYKRVSAAQQDQLKLTTERQRLEGLTTSEMEKRKASVEAESEVRKRQIDYAREELSILQEREKLAQTNAQRLGGMTKMQRKRAVDSLEQLEKIGVEHAPEWMKQRAMQVAPKTVTNLFEQAGEKTPEFARLQKLAGSEYRDRLPDIRKQVDAKQKQAGEAVQFDMHETAKGISEAFERGARDLVRLTQGMIRDAVNKITLDLRHGIANSGGFSSR